MGQSRRGNALGRDRDADRPRSADNTPAPRFGWRPDLDPAPAASPTPDASAEAESSDTAETREPAPPVVDAAPSTDSTDSFEIPTDATADVATPSTDPSPELAPSVEFPETTGANEPSQQAEEPDAEATPIVASSPTEDVPAETGSVWTPSTSSPSRVESQGYYRPRDEQPNSRRAVPAAAIIGLVIVLIVGAFVAFDFLNQQDQVASTDRPSPTSGTSQSAAPVASATPRPSPTAVAASPSPSPSAAATAKEENPESTPGDPSGEQSAYVPSWVDDSGSDSNDTSPGGATGGNDASAGSSPGSNAPVIDQTPPAPSPAPSNPPAPSPSPSSAPGQFGPAAPAAANPGCTYVSETQHNLCGGFRDYWNTFDGLAVFGLPLTEEFQENGVTIQYFERARFEWHPGSWTERYDVRLGLVGNTVTADRSGEAPFQPTGANGNCTYYSQTHHNLCGGFRDYWNKFGGLAVYGMPISEEFEERNPDDGQIYTVQYFERARFEWHLGASPERFDVVLGRLGAQELQSKYGDAK